MPKKSNKKLQAGGKKKGRRSAQAPGQSYGYSIQTTRMVARLLQCTNGQAVSLEVLDDVAVTGGSKVIAEQSKSGLAHNPVTDRSVDLWKTLFNWVGAIRSGALAADVKFILYVAQPYSGKIIAEIDGIRRPEDAASLIGNLRDEFWGPAPNRKERANLPGTIAPYVNGVLEASDNVLSRLFAGFEFVTGTGSPVGDLTVLLQQKAIGSSAIENVKEMILGWTKKRVEELIEAKKPAIITWEEFNRQLILAARRFDRSDLLTPTPVEITESEVEKELQSRPYIRQLRWVDCKDEELVRAVRDYLRSAVDRTSWSERGDVLEVSFEEFSDRLERYWDNQRRLASIELRGRTEPELGQAVLARCMSVLPQLQGLDVPSYFVPGSYHSLADSFRIGWHPRFNELRIEIAQVMGVGKDTDDGPGGDA